MPFRDPRPGERRRPAGHGVKAPFHDKGPGRPSAFLLTLEKSREREGRGSPNIELVIVFPPIGNPAAACNYPLCGHPLGDAGRAAA